MDRLSVLLRELLHIPTTSQHCSHVIIRLLRRIVYGIRGEPELRYILEDLLESLPEHKTSEEIRKISALLLGAKIPLKSAKRTNEDIADIDQSRHKRPKRAIEDAQLLYNYLNPLPSSILPHTPDIRSLLSSTPTDLATSVSVPRNLAALYSRIAHLIPDRGTMIDKKAKLRILCEVTGPTMQDTITALDRLAELASQLCAPVRDLQATELRDSVAKCRGYLSLSKPEIDAVVAESFAQCAKLLEDMERDMKQFQLGLTTVANSEQELQLIVKREAMKREKEALTEQEKPVLQSTESWLKGLLPDEDPGMTQISCRQALIEALFSQEPVSLDEASSSSNALPPIFYLALRHLWLLQNRIQTATILATLSTLLPVQSRAEMPASQRIWTILLSEVDTVGDVDSDHVKIANIEDEILRAVQEGQPSTLDGPASTRLREDVRRMVRLDDPVYKLLNGRLKSALLAAVPAQPIKGFQVEPLPSEVSAMQQDLKGILEWAYESWSIPPG